MVSRYVPDMGDLIWVDFDPTKGSEQAGHRPAVRPESFHVQQQNRMCLCVPCTTQSKGYPFEVVLSGQERDGVVLADQKVSPGGKRSDEERNSCPEELQLIKAKINVLIG
ncbi:endoribonuclease MazF [Escherichia coli]